MFVALKVEAEKEPKGDNVKIPDFSWKDYILLPIHLIYIIINLDSLDWRIKMASWQMQQAKQQFSELVKMAVDEGDQQITYRGEEIAWIVSAAEYHKLKKEKKSIIELFANSPCKEIELNLARSKDLPRMVNL